MDDRRQLGGKQADTRSETAAGLAATAPKPSKTTGERYYDALEFLTGNVFILAATAGIAYVARYGRESYHGVPNYLKQFQGWFEGKLLHNKVFSLEKSEFGRGLAGAAASTTLTMWGGNFFAPVMKALEGNKERISSWFNARYGAPGEVEAGHARLKDTPKPNWGDIIKGRAAGWVGVFGSFLAVDQLLGKSKATGMRRFEQYEEWFGRKTAGLSAGGKEIAKTKLTEALSAVQKEHKGYRLGKILALDLYATTAAILIWNVISRDSAKQRVQHEEVSPKMHAGVVETDGAAAAAVPVDNRPVASVQPGSVALQERVGQNPAESRSIPAV